MALPESADTSRTPLQATFPGGSVVQLVDGDPSTSGALVASLHPATIVLTDSRVSAVEGDLEWSWQIRDLQEVHHSALDGWSILVVPGVPDHGVAVSEHDRMEFRDLLDEARTRAGLANAAPSPASSMEPPLLAPRPAQRSVDPPPSTDEGLWRVAGDHVVDLDDPTTLVGTGWASRDGASVAPDDLVVVPPEEPEIDLGPGFDLDDEAGPLPQEPDPTAAPTLHSRDAPVSEEMAGAVRPKARSRWTRKPARGARAQVSIPAPTLAALEAQSISAWFGTHHVLDRVSLTMHPGQVTALIGPSGCGKSTFLRILNRMHELIPSASLAGEVRLDGADIYDPSRKLTDARRQIGMVFQKPNPFPAMSIYENVVASFRLTGVKVSTAEKDEVVESCLTKAGLWNEVRDRLRQPGGSLSGGQQQRLCIARALALRPRVLLMDEPCSALDPTSTRRIEQTIVELRSEVTIVIVTHNMQQAARVSDQCAFFLAEAGTPGVIVEHGDTEAMFHSPQDERTSAYVNGRFG